MTDSNVKKKDDHDKGCPRAFSALALAHSIVSSAIEKALETSFGLTLNEFDVLVDLDSRPENWASATSLVTAARLSQPAISRLIDRLENKGFVYRLACPEDKRRVTVRLTEQGKAILQQAIPIHNQCVQEKLLAHLSETERAILRTALLKVVEVNCPSKTTNCP